MSAVDAAEERLAPLEEAANIAHWALATDATDDHAQRAARRRSPTRRRCPIRPPRRAAAAPRPPPTRSSGAGPTCCTSRRPPPAPAALRDRIVALETELQGRFSAAAPSSGAARSPTTRSPRSCSAPPTSPSAARRGSPGGVSATSSRRPARADRACATRRRRRSGTATTMRSRSPWKSSTRVAVHAARRSGARPDRALDGEKTAIDADVRGRLGLRPTPGCSRGTTPTRSSRIRRRRGGSAARRRRGRRRPATARAYFAALGHDVDAILARSDLEPRRGKDQHAFQITVVRGSDIRTLCNLEPTLRWLETLLHELGHAIYDDSVDKSLPWLLRTHSHTFTTEAVAMLHGRRARDHVFLEQFAGIHPMSRGSREQRRRAARPAGFAAWVQVMARFERSLYADPGQDLVTTWWSQVERYQHLRRPRHRPRRLGREDPPDGRAGLLPQLPARPDDGLAARGDAGPRPRQRQPRGRSAAAGELLRERFLRPVPGCAGTSTCCRPPARRSPPRRSRPSSPLADGLQVQQHARVAERVRLHALEVEELRDALVERAP